MTGQQLVFFAIVLAAFVLLATERLRNDLVAVLIILALAGTGLLSPADAFAGLASEPAIVLASVFVLSAGLYATGVSDIVGGWIARLAGGGPTRAVAVITASVALLSAFTQHVTTTAFMLPVVLDLARQRDIPASKLLLPLSFAASLGTTIMVISAPAFLVASGVLQQFGRPGLGLLSMAPIGLTLCALGTLYMVTLGRLLIPARRTAIHGAERFRLDDYFTELTILADSPFRGKRVRDAEADQRYAFKVVGLVRGNRRMGEPLGDAVLREGDVLLVRTSPEDLVAFREEPGVELHPVQQYQATVPAREGQGGEQPEVAEGLVQVIVAPRSELAGRTLAEVDFRRRFGAIVVGLWRRRGWLDRPLSEIRLRDGDVLVLQADDEALARIARDPSFLMMVPFHGQSRPRRRAPLAAAIMLATIGAAMLRVPLELAMAAGATAMVLTRCLTPGQAYRAVDVRIFVFIAGVIPLGAAMQRTGSADLLAGWMEGLVAGWNQFAVLLALYAVVAVITEFMSDAGTTALVAPLAVALAQGLGHPPEAYVVTVAMASVTAFLTPMAHHGNLVIYGPGGFRFWDFARAGLPLTVLVALTVATVAPMLWPAGGR